MPREHSSRATTSTRKPALACLYAAILACLVMNLGCLTVMTSMTAKTTHHYYSNIATLQAATLADRVVTLQIQTKGRSKSENRVLSFSVDLDDPDWGLGEGVGKLSCNRQAIGVSRPSWKVANPGSADIEGTPLAIESLPYQFVCDYEERFRTAPEGVQVLAMQAPLEQPHMYLGGRPWWEPPDDDHLPPVGASIILISRSGCEGTTKVLYLDVVHEKEKGKRYLYAITPVTAAVDVVTFPIQLVLGIACATGAICE
jgi:hypothetical protein